MKRNFEITPNGKFKLTDKGKKLYNNFFMNFENNNQYYFDFLENIVATKKMLEIYANEEPELVDEKQIKTINKKTLSIKKRMAKDSIRFANLMRKSKDAIDMYENNFQVAGYRFLRCLSVTVNFYLSNEFIDYVITDDYARSALINFTDACINYYTNLVKIEQKFIDKATIMLQEQTSTKNA